MFSAIMFVNQFQNVAELSGMSYNSFFLFFNVTRWDKLSHDHSLLVHLSSLFQNFKKTPAAYHPRIIIFNGKQTVV